MDSFYHIYIKQSISHLLFFFYVCFQKVVLIVYDNIFDWSGFLNIYCCFLITKVGHNKYLFWLICVGRSFLSIFLYLSPLIVMSIDYRHKTCKYSLFKTHRYIGVCVPFPVHQFLLGTFIISSKDRTTKLFYLQIRKRIYKKFESNQNRKLLYILFFYFFIFYFLYKTTNSFFKSEVKVSYRII